MTECTDCARPIRRNKTGRCRECYAEIAWTRTPKEQAKTAHLLAELNRSFGRAE